MKSNIPIVQDYDIYSEGPIIGWLKLIVEDGKISHYRENEGKLELYWHPGHDKEKPLPLLGTKTENTSKQYGLGHTRYVGPSVETLASSIQAWLQAQDYGSVPDVDGDGHRGWHLTNKNCYSYIEFTVAPHWQLYGK